ncbi:2Fe-2S iron-sulfur cluster-binding protein [Shouchella patagoniensis]|uniref:2Fe-2S iron-sulfur cluster-binding protein n=1 Tax=Shouchella patagoniensis TaxID=228576 RepID=UPI0009949661|nr:2Fe-2S iron-sulfur cluster-binding protein [Shouchella patagoniensis]
MPTIHAEGYHSFTVESGKKLVLALEDNGVDILHRCGGNARCTTCLCEVIDGDAGPIGEAEAGAREKKGIEDDNMRLSCQIRVTNDLKVKPLRTATSEQMDPGKRPEE